MTIKSRNARKAYAATMAATRREDCFFDWVHYCETHKSFDCKPLKAVTR
jgi:hypothetical protein